MKYIRTKDFGLEWIHKLYSKQDENSNDYNVVIPDRVKRYSNDYEGDYTIIPKKCVYKSADTIEELCDCFISTRDDYHDIWDNFYEPRTLCSESDIYGAIWTDKGLIYVAKMNEKGELELI